MLCRGQLAKLTEFGCDHWKYLLALSGLRPQLLESTEAPMAQDIFSLKIGLSPFYMSVTLWKYDIHKAEDGPKATKINITQNGTWVQGLPGQGRR